MKTGNPSACVTVNCKVCGNSGSAVLPVVPSCVNQVSINPIIQSKTPSIVTLTRDSMYVCIKLETKLKVHNMC
jgi:hypothetical protein